MHSYSDMYVMCTGDLTSCQAKGLDLQTFASHWFVLRKFKMQKICSRNAEASHLELTGAWICQSDGIHKLIQV